MSTHESAAAALIIVAVFSITTAATTAEQSPTAEVAGQRLLLRAHATRSILFGAINLYSVGIYTDAPVRTRAGLRDPAVAKAVRIAVLYDGSMPAEVPSDWWRELAPALTAAQEQNLRDAFARLSTGDDVWVTYAAAAGTRMLYDGRAIVSSAGDQLINATLDLWLGPQPVSRDLHETLISQLGHRP